MRDSVEWVKLYDRQGETYFWNRRTQVTKRNPPPGVRVVWVGERLSEGVSRATTSLLFLLCDAAGVRGLASPHSFLGATPGFRLESQLEHSALLFVPAA